MGNIYNSQMDIQPIPNQSTSDHPSFKFYNFFRFLRVSPDLFNPWFYALLSLFLLILFFSARLITDSDLGFHLRGGQWILENHGFPTHDVYTYTVSNHEYLDIHWFYQVLLYLLYRIGSYPLLSLFNMGLIMGQFVLTFKRLRMTEAPLWMCVFLLSAALLASEIRFSVRPEILSWVYMSLMLWVLEQRVKNKRNLLILLPIIQMVWTNTEGLFGLGWGLMGFYVISDFLHSSKFDKKLFQYSILAVASCLVNPYFIHGAIYPFSLLATLDASSIFKQTIVEFQSPWTLSDNINLSKIALLTYKTSCFFLLFLLLMTFKRRKIHDFLISGVFFYLSATAFRNIPLFMFAILPLAATCWREIKWDWLQKFQRNYFSGSKTAWGFTFLTLCLAARVVTNAYYISDRRVERFGLGLDMDVLPVRATEFLVQNHLDGRILNHMSAGGWLEWKGPQKVFVDGRTDVMGEKFYSEYMDSFGPRGLESLMGQYRFDLVLCIHTMDRQWVNDLQSRPDWRLVYLDGRVAIYLRKDYAAQVPTLDMERLPAELGIPIPNREWTLNLLLAPRPATWILFLDGFYKPSIYPNGLLGLGLFNYYTGNPGDYRMAEPFFLECIRRSQGRYYDFYLNAGIMYLNTKRFDEARICMEQVLKDTPKQPAARQVLAALGVR